MPSDMPAPSARLTHADFLRFPEDGLRHELVDGEHFVSPTPVVRHQQLVGRLYFELEAFVRATGRGRVVLSPMDVILSPVDVVEPDLIFVGRGNEGIIQDWVRGVPDLLIEVVSPSNRRHDEVRKLALYERHGVAEYWIVDPEAEQVAVHRLAGDRYAPPAVLGAGDILESPLLPGLALLLARIFTPAR